MVPAWPAGPRCARRAAVWALIAAMAVVMTLVASACSSGDGSVGSATTPRVPHPPRRAGDENSTEAETVPVENFTGTDEEFYVAPKPLPAGGPGDLIRVMELNPTAGGRWWPPPRVPPASPLSPASATGRPRRHCSWCRAPRMTGSSPTEPASSTPDCARPDSSPSCCRGWCHPRQHHRRDRRHHCGMAQRPPRRTPAHRQLCDRPHLTSCELGPAPSRSCFATGTRRSPTAGAAGEPVGLRLLQRQARSKRSRFMTLSQAFTKSPTNFS